MTREEAIEYWEGLRKTFSSQLEKEENHFGRMHLQTTIDVLDTTISALRQQEVESNLKVVESNKPLTLDELRQIDGVVWVCYPQSTFGTQLPPSDNMSCSRYKFSFADYGKTWLAYRERPKED